MQFVNIYFINLKLIFYVNVSFHRAHIILQHELTDKLIPLYHLIVFSKSLVRFQFKEWFGKYQLKIVQHAKLLPMKLQWSNEPNNN